MVEKYNLNLHVGEKVAGVVPQGEFFLVNTESSVFKTRNVILCLGRRGTPRKLGVKGEDLSKVTYGLIDPDAYHGKKIIVVGGGDSAIEAALVLSKNNEVILSYRKDSFFRVKEKNQNNILKADKDGKLKVMFNSEITGISETNATIRIDGSMGKEVPNDYVFVMIGGEPAFPLLRSIGVLRSE